MPRRPGAAASLSHWERSIVYPWLNLIVTFVVLAIIYAVLWSGLHRLLARFPANEPDWKFAPAQLYLKEAVARGAVGWPYIVFNPPAPVPRVSIATVVLSSLLLAWWTQAVCGTLVRVAATNWTTLFLLALGLGPSLQRWRLTGRHRLVRVAGLQTQLSRDPNRPPTFWQQEIKLPG